MKNYTKFNAEKSAKIESVKFRFSCYLNKSEPKPNFFFGLKPSPDQDGTNKKRIFQIGPSVPKEIGFKHTKLDPTAIYNILYILIKRRF